MQPNHASQSLALPIAIIVGFIIIATALFVANSGTATQSARQVTQRSTPLSFEELATRLHQPISAITATDHIRGNPNAPIMLVTYSSFECPSCRSYHLAMHRLLQEYGQNGDLAWTFRHLPLVEQYPNGVIIANAAECVAELGGNVAFWNFTDEVFSNRDPMGSTHLSQLSQSASDAGIPEFDFNQCLHEERHFDLITAQAADATAAGSFAIPYTVVLAGEEVGVINGSVSYAELRQIVEVALANQ